MRTVQLFCLLLLSALACTYNPVCFAQADSLPTELTSKSSLAKILAWLQRTSFSNARIGLNANLRELNDDAVRTDVDQYSEWAVFASGFNLSATNGCKITLRNNVVQLISFVTKYPNPAKGSLPYFRKTGNNQTQYAGDFSIPLERLSEKGKAPFRHTKKADEATLLGTWRTEFKIKKNFSLLPPLPTKENMQKLMRLNKLEVIINGSKQDGQNESMIGDTVTFTFDNKDESEKFNAAFRLAIKQCSQK